MKYLDSLLTAHPFRWRRLMIHLRIPAEQLPLTLASDDMATTCGKMVRRRDRTPFLSPVSISCHFLPTSSSDNVCSHRRSTSFQSMVKFFVEFVFAGTTVASETESEFDSEEDSEVASEVGAEVDSDVGADVASGVLSGVSSKAGSDVVSEVASEEVSSRVGSVVVSELRSVESGASGESVCKLNVKVGRITSKVSNNTLARKTGHIFVSIFIVLLFSVSLHEEEQESRLPVEDWTGVRVL